MCKRAVERYHNEPKRAKKLSADYTQGPLDEVFGQHRAFPIESAAQTDDDTGVYQYLASVRKEAENDRVFHFVETRRQRNDTISHGILRRTEHGVSHLSESYMANIMERLHASKEDYEKQLVEETSFSVGQIDFSQSDDHSANQEIYKDEENVEVSENSSLVSDSIPAQTDNLSLNSSDHFKVDATAEEDLITETIEENKKIQSEKFTIPDSAAKWRSLVFTTQPPPQEYWLALEHTTIIKLIVYFTKWLSGSVPDTLFSWVFATFVRLDNALDHQELAIVRALGLKARKLHGKFSEATAEGTKISEVAISCVDMILTVVSEYYGQKDLLMEP